MPPARRTLLNEAFTSNSLQAQLQQNAFTILHLATHGQFSSNPEDTFILTWNSKIKVRELQDLLQTQGTTATPLDLLVLSACETASGDDRVRYWGWRAWQCDRGHALPWQLYGQCKIVPLQSLWCDFMKS
ncbi:MAG: CHAT domain-containing protein [Coleofasciculaceae cyanobacterium SM2_3_26]|nr:CHAT domain-containing protein [Coleofasciculaceae cyanobacterium SM2_3_26]